MLKFQKLVDTRTNINYDWMLVLDTHESVMDYHEKSMKSEVSKAWDNLIKVSQGKAHISNSLSLIIHYKHKDNTKPKSIVEHTIDILNKLITDKLKLLDKYGIIYINKVGGYFPHHNDIIVKDECYIDEQNIIFPQYTEKDIRVKKWEGGKHYYSYVGSFQVIARDGTNKWNTEEKAYEQARYFLYRINNKQFEFKS